MRVGELVFSGAVRCSALWRRSKASHVIWAGVGLVLLAMAGVNAPAAAGPIDEGVTDLPWSALPDARAGVQPLQLSVPRVPLIQDSDPRLLEWSAEPVRSPVGTALWASDDGAVLLGFAVDQEKESEDKPGDRLFGDLRKRYTAVLAFDQPLGFSTALIVDVLSKDKRRGQREFKIFQIAVSHPFGEGGSISGGSAVVLDGLRPNLNIGVRLFLPLGGE